MNEKLLALLNKCNIGIENSEHLEGLLLSRDHLLSKIVYEQLKDDITIIKKEKSFSSSSLTALQKTAVKQKWPLLNLVRQLLKVSGYHMKPVRKSAGYDEHGKKLFKRFFMIEKIKKPVVEKIKTE